MFRHLALLSIAITAGIHGNHLTGDHICPQDERYTITVEKHFKKNVTIREFVWCVSVPPRCSKYKTVQVDDVKIIEEERTRQVKKCCIGYTESKNQTHCIPTCDSCIHGTCISPETCLCSAGYTGTSCNKTCPASFWGQGCALRCECASPSLCQPDTGYCICEPGTTGSKCETSILNNSSTCVNCNEAINNIQENVNSTNNSSDKVAEMNFTHLPTQKTTLSTKTHSEMKIRREKIERGKIKSNHDFTITTSPVIDIIEKSKKNSDSIGKMHQYSANNLEHWQMDEIAIESGDSSADKSTLLIFIISITVGIAIILILVTIMSIIIARYKKQRDIALKNVLGLKSCNSTDNNKNRLSTQPIIRRSTFHAPLPDPPTFQNPVFTLPENLNIDKVHYIQNFSAHCIDFQYDYPPPSSTHNHRTSSVPDSTYPEPLYDEIPATRRPRPVSGALQCRNSCCVDTKNQWNNT